MNMGFFSRLFGSEASQPGVEEAVSDVYKVDVTLKANHSVTSTKGLQGYQCQNYFREILQTEFPEYTFKENVAVQELVGNVDATFRLYKTRPHQAYKAEWGAPYTFVVVREGRVVAVIMLAEKWKQYNNVKYLISKMYMKKMGVAYIPFYTELANDIGYVVSRLRKTLQ